MISSVELGKKISEWIYPWNFLSTATASPSRLWLHPSLGKFLAFVLPIRRTPSDVYKVWTWPVVMVTSWRPLRVEPERVGQTRVARPRSDERRPTTIVRSTTCVKSPLTQSVFALVWAHLLTSPYSGLDWKEFLWCMEDNRSIGLVSSYKYPPHEIAICYHYIQGCLQLFQVACNRLPNVTIKLVNKEGFNWD